MGRARCQECGAKMDVIAGKIFCFTGELFTDVRQGQRNKN